MRKLHLFLILIILNSTFVYSQDKQDSDWQYLGQEPPGLHPEIFAPGIISGNGRLHCFPSFSADGKEVVWMTLPPKLLYVNYNETWSEPRELPFTKNYRCMFPVHSCDNNRLYFASNNIPGGAGNLDIWYVEKTDTNYSEPINLGLPINTIEAENQPVFTKSGNIYYTGFVQGKRWDRGILYSKFESGEYLTPQLLNETINIIDTNAIDYTPFISKDESYLLFSSNRQNIENEDCRIYISLEKTLVIGVAR